MNCESRGEDLVAFALGACDAAERASIEQHLATCGPCRDEVAATRRLVEGALRAPLLEPAADGEARLLAAVLAENDATVPAPQPQAATSRGRRILRLASFALPLAAAAAVLVAILASEGAMTTASVLHGNGTLSNEAALGDRSRGPNDRLRLSQTFTFGRGAVLQAGEGELGVALALRPGSATPSGTQPAAGRVELTLSPGARLVRRSESELELVEGSLEVAAGPLASSLSITHGDLVATVRGTRFLAVTAGARLAVVVREGRVDLGRRGGAFKALDAGRQGLVDAERLLERDVEAGRPADAFLTPRIQARLQPRATGSVRAPLVEVTLSVGEGGPVAIEAFDDAEARFMVRLTGPDGREREVKLQRSMLVLPPPPTAGRTFRLSRETPYRLVFTLEGIGLAPGRHTCRVRSISYRPRGEADEWLGMVESEPLDFEVER